MLKIHNTYSAITEKFKPIVENEVKMYIIQQNRSVRGSTELLRKNSEPCANHGRYRRCKR